MAAATKEFNSVAVAFVFDRNILNQLEDKDDKRLTFIHDSLAELDRELSNYGSRLVVFDGDPQIEIPAFASRIGAEAVFCNRDYEPYAINRDLKISQSTNLTCFKDQVVFERQEVVTGTGGVHRVYTPYMRAWREKLRPTDLQEHIVDPAKFSNASLLREEPKLEALSHYGFVRSHLWLRSGETAGAIRLSDFAANSMAEYHKGRDFPVGGATSGLSVHLRFGTVSIRNAFRSAAASASEGAEKWTNELIWREFYQMILANFPHVVGRAFRSEFDKIEWPGSEEHFTAWKTGRTGYPIVDAAMRCLNETGWMHNRLRMIAASFLVKDLLIDWRRGEAFFARKLLDFDLASNNGGWQWCASTGVDAQPTFRIFNPWLQSAKFDSQGEFIRQWIPELRDASVGELHKPMESSLLFDYPPPIVDHARQRNAALALLSSAARSK